MWERKKENKQTKKRVKFGPHRYSPQISQACEILKTHQYTSKPAASQNRFFQRVNLPRLMRSIKKQKLIASLEYCINRKTTLFSSEQATPHSHTTILQLSSTVQLEYVAFKNTSRKSCTPETISLYLRETLVLACI